MAITLLTGGARSGKSALAARIGDAWSGGVTFVATAEALDDEMRDKISQHRAARPPAWRTIEEPLDLVPAISDAPAGDLVIVDCLTLWVANLLERGATDAEITAAVEATCKVAAARPEPVVVVTNEVGDGIVPADPATRRYRNLMGFVNAAFAREAGRVVLVVAGRAVTLGNDQEVIDDVVGR
jgi:adenosylcobinamide kinase / adenosylcobinamide-phosphate guanylyltransferase